MNRAIQAVASDGMAMSYDVAYADTDAGGIVYHARYVEMAERSRNRTMAAMGMPVQQMLARFGMQFVIREVRALCHRPALVGDRLNLTSGVTTMSQVRVNWRTRIACESEIICDVEAQIAAFDPVSRRASLMPDTLIALLGQTPRMVPLRRAPTMKPGL